MPNPLHISPNNFVSMRGAQPDQGLGSLNLRQGASYNSFNYLSPKIIWRGYTMYPKTKFSRNYMGYDVTITQAEILLLRAASGGSGGAVSPRLWWHGYSTPSSVGTALYGAQDLAPLGRSEGGWRGINLDYARRLANPADTGVQGVAVYHPNEVLLSYLGEVSAEYMILNGPFTSAFGVPIWTVQFYHDG
jgi:hypothetical protein